MQDIYLALRENLDSLKGIIKKRLDISTKRARAEYEYRSALGREMAYEKANGMAATSLYDYCRGKDYIAELRAQRDILMAQEEYLTELIYYYRAEIRIAEGMANAERKGV